MLDKEPNLPLPNRKKFWGSTVVSALAILGGYPLTLGLMAVSNQPTRTIQRVRLSPAELCLTQPSHHVQIETSPLRNLLITESNQEPWSFGLASYQLCYTHLQLR